MEWWDREAAHCEEAGAVIGLAGRVDTEDYTVFIQPGGVLGLPWFLTFGKKNAATLAYEGHLDAHGQSKAAADVAAKDADGDANEDDDLLAAEPAAERGGGVLA